MGADAVFERGDRPGDAGVALLEARPLVNPRLVLLLARLEGVVVNVLFRVGFGEPSALRGEEGGGRGDARTDARRELFERAREGGELRSDRREELSVLTFPDLARDGGRELFPEGNNEPVYPGPRIADGGDRREHGLPLAGAEPFGGVGDLQERSLGPGSLKEGAELLLNRARLGGVALEGDNLGVEGEEGLLVGGQARGDSLDLRGDRAELLAREAVERALAGRSGPCRPLQSRPGRTPQSGRRPTPRSRGRRRRSRSGGARRRGSARPRSGRRALFRRRR